MSSEWDDLEADAKSVSDRRGPKCGVTIMLGIIRNDFGQAAYESVVRTLANVRLTGVSIHKALESRVTPGDLPSSYSIQRHRTGRCSCPRDTS